nr:hypothetical protein [Colwellia hornerae]
MKKEQFSKLAGITVIIDVYDAITVDKAYKKGLQPINALRYLLADKSKFGQQLV